MIRVDRNLVVLPSSVEKALSAANTDARAFYTGKKDRSQKRYTFKTQPWEMARDTLKELFWDTCAYCETPGSVADLVVEKFRPTTEASQLNGEADPDWYWWLAYKWENLYLACADCVQHKGNRFPVSAKRLPKQKPLSGAASEANLLLDPCRDEPTEYLRFRSDGEVEGISSSTPSTQHRGIITINVLGLNRAVLVQNRKQMAMRANRRLDPFRSKRRTYKEDELKTLVLLLEELVDDLSSFVAVKKHLVAKFLLENPALDKTLLGKYPSSMRRIHKDLKRYTEVERSFTTKGKIRRKTIKPAPPKEEVTIAYDNIYITRIQIRNFRNIQLLDLQIKPEVAPSQDILNPDLVTSGATSFRAGWKMLLGENATGKSSVLKAVALALMGERAYRSSFVENRLEPNRIFNRSTTQKNGFIKLTLSKGDPIEVTFTRKNLNFISGASAAENVFIRGYGSARLFGQPQGFGHLPASPAPSPTMGATTPPSPEMHGFTNLLHPERVLSHPIEWLSTNIDTLDSTALAFRDLLNLPETVGRPLTQSSDEILLNTGDGPVPISEQSDGYKTVLAFVLDILAGLPRSVKDKSTATGIVLIDELDSHLHPKWKMRIVRSLRKTFPKLQFIATTHEPLCLRGLGEGEIAVMRKIDGVVDVDDDLPSPENLRIDQLLTSELFGLESTIDPVIDEKFYNYYQLLANTTEGSNNLTKKDRDGRAKDLRRELMKYNTLGFTRRDQMVYDLIDKYLATKGKLTKSQQKNFHEETKTRVFELWDLISLRNE